MTDDNKPPKGFVYLPVKEVTGVDLPGLIAVPISEIELKEKEDNAKNGK